MYLYSIEANYLYCDQVCRTRRLTTSNGLKALVRTEYKDFCVLIQVQHCTELL